MTPIQADPKAWADLTVLSAVPTVLAALANVPLAGADISSLRYGRTGAAPLPPELAARFVLRHGASRVALQKLRGTLVGLTRGTGRAHIARAALEAIALQSADVFDAMSRDAGVPLRELRVDGGASVNDWMMQFQADILGIPVVCPKTLETTALGAAFGAGLAAGVWKNEQELASHWREGQRWTPTMDAVERHRLIDYWHKAVSKSLDWVD